MVDAVIKFCPLCGNKLSRGTYDLGQAYQSYPFCKKCRIGFFVKTSNGYTVAVNDKIYVLGEPELGVAGEDNMDKKMEEYAKKREKIMLDMMFNRGW